MTTKYTPGPWHVETFGGRHEIWPKDGGQTHTYVGTVQITADAQLIAAAPELLEACQAALSRQDWPVGTMKIKAQLASSIAKATGQGIPTPAIFENLNQTL